VSWASIITAIAASFALLPFVVFNQQIITGKTMQPYHFAAFVVNYSVLVGLLLTVALLWKPVPTRVLVWIAVLSFSWGVVEVGLPARFQSVPAAVVNDQMVPVLRRLKELSKQDGTLVGLHTEGQASTLVFSPQLGVTVLLPTWTSQGTLLDIGGLDFGSTSREERKEFFYLHLYYSKADIGALRKALAGVPDDAGALFRFTDMYPRMFGGQMWVAMNPPTPFVLSITPAARIHVWTKRGDTLPTVSVTASPCDCVTAVPRGTSRVCSRTP